jgi:peptide/nickel transport system substrate-binding protein
LKKSQVRGPEGKPAGNRIACPPGGKPGERERIMSAAGTSRRILSVLFVFAVAVCLSPLSGMAQEIKQGGTAIVALADRPDSLIPGVSYLIAHDTIVTLCHEGLIDYDMQGNMVPALAKSWEFSPDGKTWTFHLQSGVKWHDGKDFTSADVAFSIKEVAEKFHPLGKQAYGPISRIETPNAQTAVFKFDKPYSPAASYLSGRYAGILPKHLFENTDIKKNPHNFKPIGTGPFMFQEYKEGSHVAFVKNPNYWRKGKPYLDKVVCRIILDGASRILAFEKGEVDVLPPYSMAISEMERFRKMGAGAEAFWTPAASINLVLMNLGDKYLGDRRVRYALSHAVNRQEIIDKAYFGYGKPAVGPIPPSIPWAFTDDLPKFEYDPAKANRMLDEAGYKRGTDGIRFPIDYVYVGTFTEYDRTARIIQAQLREVGVDVKLRPMEQAASIEEVFKKRNFGFFYHSLTMGPDPAVGTARLYLTSQIRATSGVTNAMGYSNPEVDRLFEEGGSAPSREAAGEKYKQVQKLITKDMPCLWIMYPPYVMGFNAKLAGLPAGPYWLHTMQDVGWKK